jgi:cytochrome c-type biogenesis protein CcmH
MTPTVQALQQRLQQLRALHAAGSLSDERYNETRATLERQLVDELVNAPALPAAGAAPAAAVHSARMGKPMLTALGALALLVAAGGYVWTGSPGQIGQTPAGFGANAEAGPEAAGGAAAPHALSQDQMAALTEKLAERLKANPDDAEGWTMLARSYGALGRTDEALAAFDRVLKLRPDDASTMADYADALAVKNGRTLEGEPLKWVERALKRDPDNLKALLLAGTAAFNRSEFALAAQLWDRAGKAGPPGNALSQQAIAGAAEARERGKLPPAADAGLATATATAAPAAAASEPNASAAAAGGAITGTASLAPALLAKVSATDTVFIYARAATGSRMPLAILRKQVKDLPVDFQLDDSQAMSPATRLSAAPGPLVVGVRVSKSGQAMSQPGDLEGVSAPLRLGASGVKVLVSDPVK